MPLFKFCLVNIYLRGRKERERTVSYEVSAQHKAVVTKVLFSYIVKVDGHMNEPPAERQSWFTGSVAVAVPERSVWPSSSVAS